MAFESNGETRGTTAFDRFLKVAREKPSAQKLLLVFAAKELRPDEPASGSPPSGEDDFCVTPVMYTDKAVAAIDDFTHLRDDSLDHGKPWDFLFLTALDAAQLSPALIQQRLELMVKLIQQGETDRFLIFNALGHLAELSKVAEQTHRTVQ